MTSYDVIIYDSESTPHNPRIAQERGLGGVEWVHMNLADALWRSGRSVLVLNKGDAVLDEKDRPIYIGGWRRPGLEYGHISRCWTEKLSCQAIVCSRWSPVPPVQAKRVVFSYHDIPERWMFASQRRYLDEGAEAVCVSTWLADKLDGVSAGKAWKRAVIAPILLDECYELGEKDENKMVYASAAIKGARVTLDTWATIRANFMETHWGALFMATNGYDNPSKKDQDRMVDMNVHPLGQLPARGIIRELRSAAGLFFVNNFAETHAIIVSTALALGCRLHILALDGLAALPETSAGSPLLTTDRQRFIEEYVEAFLDPSNPRWKIPADCVPDRRARAILPQWEEVLFT